MWRIVSLLSLLLVVALPAFAQDALEATVLPNDPAPATAPASPGVPTAEKHEEKKPSSWGIELAGGTMFPVSVGGLAGFHMPGGLFLESGVGVMPRGYVKTINAILVGANAYKRQTADFIADSLSTSLVVDASLGWDPGERGGFKMAIGYNMMALGGRSSSLTLIKQATGKTPPTELSVLLQNTKVPVKTTLHNVTLRLGYQAVFFDVLTLDLYLGALKTFASSSTVDLKKYRNSYTRETIDNYTHSVNSYMNHLYVHYVLSPIFGLTLGVRLF